MTEHNAFWLIVGFVAGFGICFLVWIQVYSTIRKAAEDERKRHQSRIAELRWQLDVGKLGMGHK